MGELIRENKTSTSEIISYQLSVKSCVTDPMLACSVGGGKLEGSTISLGAWSIALLKD